MKKLIICMLTLTLPFISYTGPGKGVKEGAFADVGKHAGEIASQNLKDAAQSFENSTKRVCDTIEDVPNVFENIGNEAEALMNAAALLILIGYGTYKTVEFTATGVSTCYRYMNGTLDAYRAEQKRLEEEAKAKAEEEKLKALIAAQEVARLKRNAEIETEFNQCYMNRFSSPTRKRNGIPSGCELQGFQLVSTGKFKSMQELKEYYKS